jgi:hypothetical protein
MIISFPACIPRDQYLYLVVMVIVMKKREII